MFFRLFEILIFDSGIVCLLASYRAQFLTQELNFFLNTSFRTTFVYMYQFFFFIYSKFCFLNGGLFFEYFEAFFGLKEVERRMIDGVFSRADAMSRIAGAVSSNSS